MIFEQIPSLLFSSLLQYLLTHLIMVASLVLCTLSHFLEARQSVNVITTHNVVTELLILNNTSVSCCINFIVIIINKNYNMAYVLMSTTALSLLFSHSMHIMVPGELSSSLQIHRR